MTSDQFSLSWNNFYSNLTTGFHSLYESEDFVDVTLAAEGRYLKAHKMVLSVCSQYFKELFRTNPCKHPIVVLKDVSYNALRDLIQFMYLGEVNVSQDELSELMKVAESLQIKGLTGEHVDTSHSNQNGLRTHNSESSSSSSLLKRPHTKSNKRSSPPQSAPTITKMPRTESHDPESSETVECSTPNLSVELELESDLMKSIELKKEPVDNESTSEEQSLPEMDMASMLDMNLGETSSQNSLLWKSEQNSDSDFKSTAESSTPGMFMFTHSRKGMPHLVYDSNLFRPSGKIGSSAGYTHRYWECVQNRKQGCKARCLSTNGQIITKCRDHNHQPPHDYILQRQQMGAIYYMAL